MCSNILINNIIYVYFKLFHKSLKNEKHYYISFPNIFHKKSNIKKNNKNPI